MVNGLLGAGVFFISLGGAEAVDYTAKTFVNHSESVTNRSFKLLSASENAPRYTYDLDLKHPLYRLFVASFAAGGIALGDLDGDERPDLFISGGASRNALFLQAKSGGFTEDMGFSELGNRSVWSAGPVLVDIEGDGDLDIYVCNYDAPNFLYVNDGKGQFSEEAARFNLDVRDACLAAAFCDYDRDGDLDVYLLTYQYFWDMNNWPHTVGEAVKKGMDKDWDRYFQKRGTDWGSVGRPDRLLRNEGNGSFKDVTVEAGLQAQVPGYGNSVTWWDFNADGWLDIYVGNDFKDPDFLYLNQGDGTFREMIREATPHTTWFSMGASVGDFNNDGYFDLMISDMAATTHFRSKMSMGDMNFFQHFLDTSEPRQFMRNALFLGTGTTHLKEAAYISGLAKTDWTWAVKAGDLDHDGREDLFFANGIPRPFRDSDRGTSLEVNQPKVNQFDLFADLPEQRERNRTFRNMGALHFEEVGADWGLDHEGMSYASAMGDLDRDGDLDLVVSNLGEPVHVYLNQVATEHSITLRLKGKGANTYGLGAQIEVKSSSGTQVRCLNPHQGFMSSDIPEVHVGLGSDTRVERVKITWPNGDVQELKNLPVDQYYSITQKGGAERVMSDTSTLFERSEILSFARHKENDYNDFAQQALLPYRPSRLGPGMAWGDVDGDGDEDVYIGGAAGQSGELQFAVEGGKFKWKFQKIFQNDREAEDMGALFFDADDDGDLDLYVVSGGYEKAMRDRLYMNDGKGVFSPAPEGTLPDLVFSGGPVMASDVDQDGDLDLVVGGRLVPGRYPEPVSSYLLINDHGTFTPVPLPASKSLVTGGCFADVNGDGWEDLLLTTEFGPVRILLNNKGTFQAQVDPVAPLGWWNGIAPGDVDRDGDVDFVVTNFGLNTKYKASRKKPRYLFYGDFDETGKPKIVEAKYEGSTLLPERGKSCSTHCMPMLKDRFPTFRQFALADLQQIYTPTKLQASLELKADTLESMLMINDGEGRFSWRPLPREAQLAPAFGVVVTELNGDGCPDIFMAGNFYHPQRETPRMAGGLGCLLLGDGKGNFASVAEKQSGIAIPEDARSVTVTDIDGDGRPDLAVTVNDGKTMAFLNRAASPERFVPMKHGEQLEVAGHPKQTVYAPWGSSYLGQSSSMGWAGVPEGVDPSAVKRQNAP